MLQGLAVLHHGFDGVGVEGSGEALCLALHTLDDGHGHELLGKVGIDLQHGLRLTFSLFAGGVGGMALLPQEFAGAEEGTGAHLPAHDVSPLVAQDGQVAVAVYPVLVGAPDDGLAGGADDELLFQLGGGVNDDAVARLVRLQTVVGDDGALLGKALDVLGLAAQERFGDEERKIGVDVAGGLEHVVELTLYLFPDGVAVGLDDHASAHG